MSGQSAGQNRPTDWPHVWDPACVPEWALCAMCVLECLDTQVPLQQIPQVCPTPDRSCACPGVAGADTVCVVAPALVILGLLCTCWPAVPILGPCQLLWGCGPCAGCSRTHAGSGKGQTHDSGVARVGAMHAAIRHVQQLPVSQLRPQGSGGQIIGLCGLYCRRC